MKNQVVPSLNRTIGSRVLANHSNLRTTYTNNYLKNIRRDLMEEKENAINDTNNSEIAYIVVKVNNINATAMIDTGACLQAHYTLLIHYTLVL